jgi:ectoine hydroxylase-related dioxygenase (phytanoyl-CoA dioxygenase family)
MYREVVERQGFTIIPNVADEAEFANGFGNLISETARRSKAGVRHALRYSSVAALTQDSRLLHVAQDVLGRGAFPFRATLFDKSPEANWLVVWHQDTALPLRERRDAPGWGPWSVKEGVNYAHAPESALNNVLALRFHLDDSTEENGPLRVLPGTHKLGVLSDDSIHQLSAQIAAVGCLVPRGGVLAMRPLLVHSSPKLKTTATRRVLHIEYSISRTFAEGLELAVA